MTAGEQARILGFLADEAFADLSVSQVFYRVMDQGVFIASEASWHRIARAKNPTGDRRRQATHPSRAIPVLCATRPNQVWSWDITVLPSIDRGRTFKLYAILDVFSRKVVGWRVEDAEVALKAVDMLETAITHEATPEVLHADRGAPMISGTMKTYLARHGITASHSRPHVSNDNPFSEAQFKTMKYDLGYPGKFASLEHARTWAAQWITAYNTEHRHSGIGHYPPSTVHDGTWTILRNQRQRLLNTAYAHHPDRYHHRPHATTIQPATWINPPNPELSHTG